MEGVVEHSGKVVFRLLLRSGTGLPDHHNDNCDDDGDDNCDDDDDHPEHTGEGGVAEKEKDEEDERQGFQARWSCPQWYTLSTGQYREHAGAVVYKASEWGTTDVLILQASTRVLQTTSRRSIGQDA